ncbi:MAG: phosphoribosylanthranilate isomerase [Chthoniobacterales bacterium]
MKDFFRKGSLRVKICGITNPEDAQAAIDAGADALGFNLFPGSKRHLALADLEKWIAHIPDSVTRVAVVVNTTAEELRLLREKAIFDAIQFHGDESPEFTTQEGGPLWIRAVRVDISSALDRALEYTTPHLLFDGFSAHEYGGTGVVPNWTAIAAFRAAQPERQTILAGGLTPENVAEAVGLVAPHAVDVASGVESSPGKKDLDKVVRFIREAKSSKS